MTHICVTRLIKIPFPPQQHYFVNVKIRNNFLPKYILIVITYNVSLSLHDDVIKWKHFPCHWPFVRGIQWSPVNFPHKGQRCGILLFSLICAWINSCSKQLLSWWFETPSCPLWSLCNDVGDFIFSSGLCLCLSNQSSNGIPSVGPSVRFRA